MYLLQFLPNHTLFTEIIKHIILHSYKHFEAHCHQFPSLGVIKFLTTTSSRIFVGHGLEWNSKRSSSCCFLLSRSWILFSISNWKPMGWVSFFTGGLLGRSGPLSKILWLTSRALNLYLWRNNGDSHQLCIVHYCAAIVSNSSFAVKTARLIRKILLIVFLEIQTFAYRQVLKCMQAAFLYWVCFTHCKLYSIQDQLS